MSSIAVASPLPLAYRSSPRRSALPAATVVLAHLLVIWAALQNDTLRVLVHDVKPLRVALISDVAPPAPAPVTPMLRPPPLPVAPTVPLAPWPAITVAPTPAPPSPQAPVAAAPVAVAVAAAASAVPVAVAPAPAPAAEPRKLASTAIRYRVPPPIEVPLASRRLGESGTVLLRVLVDAQGLPRQISLHRSSGHARLDEQALAAMRKARFQAQTENGVAVEWLVIAPLVFELD